MIRRPLRDMGVIFPDMGVMDSRHETIGYSLFIPSCVRNGFRGITKRCLNASPKNAPHVATPKHYMVAIGDVAGDNL